MLKTLVEVLSVAQKNKYAVIAPDFFSLDFAKILLECGEKYQAPLILSYFENNKETFELKELGKCIRIVREESARASIPVVLHLDHADKKKIIQIGRAHV